MCHYCICLCCLCAYCWITLSSTKCLTKLPKWLKDKNRHWLIHLPLSKSTIWSIATLYAPIFFAPFSLLERILYILRFWRVNSSMIKNKQTVLSLWDPNIFGCQILSVTKDSRGYGNAIASLHCQLIWVQDHVNINKENM